VPREPRIYIEKVLYLITSKGLEDSDLFLDYQDYAEYLKLLSESKSEYGFKLYAYALLPKRLCLLVELENGVTISTIMHNLNSKYTKMYNNRYGKKGHLFQSRFKSILIEKEDYLLRLTRYIHLLPKDSAANDNFSEYAYSSYPMYRSENNQNYIGLDSPNMSDEIKEVLKCFSGSESYAEKLKAYESYIHSADDKEIEIVQKLLHRTAFVGSKEFIQTIRKKIKNHIQKEEESRIVRKINPGYALAGGLVVLFLSVVTYNFYNNQTALQKTISVTTTGFDAARADLVKRMGILETEITGYEQKENHGLGGFAWELKLTPVRQAQSSEFYTDKLQFKGGQVISAKLMAKGYTPFDYTLTKRSHGKIIWETTQTNTEGATARWYGIIAGDTMRGVLSENPVSGQSRDFSFVSVRRVNKIGRTENVVQ